MHRSILICLFGLITGLGFQTAHGQAAPTPTPGPVGSASTALNSNLNGGPANGQGSMGTGVKVPANSATAAIVPGAVVINSNGNTVGSTSNVAGSVQINNGGPGSVTGVSTPISPIPTYVVPGSGLGTPAGTGITVPNPNPGSVQ